MKTLPLTQINNAMPVNKAPTGKGPVADLGFGDVLKNSIDNVNEQIQSAGEMSKGLVAGEHSNIHETMIALEKANISFRLMTKVQQKALNAYQEVMRMQV